MKTQPLAQDASIPLVSFRGVNKTYDGVAAVVSNLDLDIREGEFLSLLGPSGSGKTTTLMMLAGFEDPTSGTITLAGRDLTSLPPHRRDIGMVFQDYALFPHMTVAENLAYPLRIRKMSRADISTKVRRALDMVNLARFGDRRPAALSGGQRQRVAVARALIFEPKVVLMDEPLGALDRLLREQLQMEIKHLHDRLGFTVVYVTHDQGEALTLSDRVALFHNGRIEQLGSPRQLYSRPETVFVAGFLGDNNLIPAEVVASEEGWCDVALPSGDVLRAHAARRLGAGSRALAIIRPEAIRLCPERERGTFAAEILEVIYTGDQIRLYCRAHGVERLQVKLFSAAGHLNLEPGRTVMLAVEPDAVCALEPR